MDNYISDGKVMKCRIQIYKNIGNLSLWLARASLQTSNFKLQTSMFASLNYPHPCYLLHQNKLHYTDQHLIGYQSVSGILDLSIGF